MQIRNFINVLGISIATGLIFSLTAGAVPPWVNTPRGGHSNSGADLVYLKVDPVKKDNQLMFFTLTLAFRDNPVVPLSKPSESQNFIAQTEVRQLQKKFGARSILNRSSGRWEFTYQFIGSPYVYKDEQALLQILDDASILVGSDFKTREQIQNLGLLRFLETRPETSGSNLRLQLNTDTSDLSSGSNQLVGKRRARDFSTAAAADSPDAMVLDDSVGYSAKKSRVIEMVPLAEDDDETEFTLPKAPKFLIPASPARSGSRNSSRSSTPSNQKSPMRSPVLESARSSFSMIGVMSRTLGPARFQFPISSIDPELDSQAVQDLEAKNDDSDEENSTGVPGLIPSP